jgi:serine/threonine-protein kinase
MSEPEDEAPTTTLLRAGARPRPAPPPAPPRAAPSPPTRELATGDVIDARYRVVRRATVDGGVATYEVEHVRTGRALGLELALGPAAAEALEREARAAGEAGRHALGVTDVGRTEHGTWLVRELAPGQSLRALLDDTGQLPLEASVDVALAVAEHLEAAHARGLLHRELRPDLVLLDDDPEAAFAVKVIGPRATTGDGSPPAPKPPAAPYMSLEALRAARDVDARADVFALAAVLYECLAGRKPYAGSSVGELVVAQCAGPPTHLDRLRPDLPAEVCEVVMRALSPRREDRPASMLALATSIAPFGEGWHGRWLRRHGAAPTRAAAPPSQPAPASARGDRETPTELYAQAKHDEADALGAQEPQQTAVLFDSAALRGAPVVPFVSPAPTPAPVPSAAPAPARAPAPPLAPWERAVDRALGATGDAIARVTGHHVSLFEVETKAARLAVVASFAFTVVGIALLVLALLR